VNELLKLCKFLSAKLYNILDGGKFCSTNCIHAKLLVPVRSRNELWFPEERRVHACLARINNKQKAVPVANPLKLKLGYDLLQPTK
jgi:hypothetical protein